MTDKVQKIREWVKARLDENTSKQSLPQFYGMMEEDARFLDFLDSLQEEPVSEDLEEEVRKYLLDLKGYPHVMDETEKDIKKACIHFANWQKQKMMKDAVDGLVVCNNLTHWFKDIVMEIPSFLNVGDKVKLIILKED